ncbi:MAG: oxidoreductase [Armatimonadetes bacterium 55-13]|nr:Gfo/Idh/MocA family oxidoreductase [Armatimonadota bacterium]OJU64236.1 MAG: oxidoreductase [Armatimonadetes bacterium 55-13]
MDPLRIGIIGCGNISGIYLENLQRFPKTTVLAVADIDPAKAQAAAEKYGVPALTPDELLAHEEVELVLNLTIPAVHANINDQAIAAGKHVYVEKPLATTRDAGAQTLAKASAAGVRVGSAPDTFLGAALQTCREVIDQGLIGEPIGCNGFMLGHGPEAWHPSPEFFYKPGAGPMFDMGPYYLTALVSLLGPIKSVRGATKISFAERLITSEPLNGTKVKVETPTHLIGLLEFEAGAIGQLTTSFDTWASNLRNIEVYGTEGSMVVPDPNNFNGAVQIRTAKDSEWQDVPVTRPFAQNSRGLGILDMVYAIRTNRPHRASGDLALHVLDVMQSIIESGESKQLAEIASNTERPQALAAELPADDLNE